MKKDIFYDIALQTLEKYDIIYCVLLRENDFKKESGLFFMDLEMVKYLAQLGNLTFNDEELEKTAKEMTNIIDIMDTIKDVDICYEPIKDNHNVYLKDLRVDNSAKSFETEKILANAVQSENCFVVPKVVE